MAVLVVSGTAVVVAFSVLGTMVVVMGDMVVLVGAGGGTTVELGTGVPPLPLPLSSPAGTMWHLSLNTPRVATAVKIP